MVFVTALIMVSNVYPFKGAVLSMTFYGGVMALNTPLCLVIQILWRPGSLCYVLGYLLTMLCSLGIHLSFYNSCMPQKSCVEKFRTIMFFKQLESTVVRLSVVK